MMSILFEPSLKGYTEIHRANERTTEVSYLTFSSNYTLQFLFCIGIAQ
jgi:hypothetical protein